MNRLHNKIAIITGGGQGIGEAIAYAFVQENASVLICGRTLSKLERVKTRVLKDYPSANVVPISCNITDKDSIATMVATCKESLGTPNVLVNNAGTNVFHLPLETEQSEWDRCMSNDLLGAWLCAKEVLPDMVHNKDGSIVNISSVHGHKIIPRCFPYPVAKHGLLGLTKALGIEYAQFNVRVNSISPGLIETPLVEQWYQDEINMGHVQDRDTMIAQQAAILPCKRIGTPEEVAMVAVLLASDEARYINATDILIDGGRSALYHE